MRLLLAVVACAVASVANAELTIQVGAGQPVVTITGDNTQDSCIIQPYVGGSGETLGWYFRVNSWGVPVWDSRIEGGGLRNDDVRTFIVDLGTSNTNPQEIDLRKVSQEYGFDLKEATLLKMGDSYWNGNGNTYIGSHFDDKIVDAEWDFLCFIWGNGTTDKPGMHGDEFIPGQGGSVIFDGPNTNSIFDLVNGSQDVVSLNGGEDDVSTDASGDIINP